MLSRIHKIAAADLRKTDLVKHARRNLKKKKHERSVGQGRKIGREILAMGQGTLAPHSSSLLLV